MNSIGLILTGQEVSKVWGMVTRSSDFTGLLNKCDTGIGGLYYMQRNTLALVGKGTLGLASYTPTGRSMDLN